MADCDGNELHGVIRLRFEKVAELGDEAKFSPVVKIAKFPWRLEVRKEAGEGPHAPPTLAVYVWSNWANKSGSWACKAIVKFLIKSGQLDFVRNFERIFSAKQPFIHWTRVLEPSSGGHYSSGLDILYPNYSSRGREEDSLEIEAQICVNEIIGYGVPSKEDLLYVNGKAFIVNKYLLAAHSPYFRAFFFEDKFRECQTQTFEINDREVDLEMFDKMLQCIYPDSGKPEDENVETILQLCDKYDLAVVKECCERFLIEKSRKCLVFKFRMAESYGLTSLKNHCLKYINTIEFCANLLENVAEFTGLSEESQQRLSTHLAQLSESEKTKRNLATMLQNGMNAQQGSSAGSGGPRPASLLLADPDQDHWY